MSGYGGCLPSPTARGIEVFAHGRGRGGGGDSDRAVADALVRAGLGTLLVDLLTSEEEAEDRLSARPRLDVRLWPITWTARSPGLSATANELSIRGSSCRPTA